MLINDFEVDHSMLALRCLLNPQILGTLLGIL